MIELFAAILIFNASTLLVAGIVLANYLNKQRKY
jgi:hypothetical protein